MIWCHFSCILLSKHFKIFASQDACMANYPIGVNNHNQTKACKMQHSSIQDRWVRFNLIITTIQRLKCFHHLCLLELVRCLFMNIIYQYHTIVPRKHTCLHFLACCYGDNIIQKEYFTFILCWCKMNKFEVHALRVTNGVQLTQ